MADFQQVKEAVSLEQAAQFLGLKLKPSQHQLRGACPRCNAGGDRTLALTPARSVWYCFNSSAGGSVIDLVAHIKEVPLKDAADELAKHFGIGKTTSPTVPQKVQEKEGTLKPLDYLEHDHAAVVTVGFDPDTAKALGIGYAAKGIMRGTVAVPIRDENGNLTGYIGITEARLPSSFRIGGVVELKTA